MTGTLLVIPARNEAPSMPRCAELVEHVIDKGIVDAAVVVVNGSTDDTLAAAERNGLPAMIPVTDALPAPVLGKGDALWRAIVLRPADRYVFVDADVVGLSASSIEALIAALDEPEVRLAKGAFARLQDSDGRVRPLGGRVTELLAKPLLQVLAPELRHVKEPLSGQLAVDGATIRNLPLVTGFGIEIAMLLDIGRRYGPGAIASVDIGELTHHAKDDASLVPMAHEVATALLAACGLVQPWPGGDFIMRALPMGLVVRPPAAEVDL